VECPATLNLSNLEKFNFDAFGIEKMLNSNSEIRYNLYPFKTNKKTSERIFYNYRISFNYNTLILSLYASDKYDHAGIRVLNSTCFKYLVDFFSKSAELSKVDMNITAVNSVTKIVLIGEILVSNQTYVASKEKSSKEKDEYLAEDYN
jgi:hypothetical protein